MNLALIGLRCAGKTTIGRHLAERLRREFIDLDERTLSLFPEMTVADLWKAHGEPAWRRAEVQALRDALDASRAVIALGGGTLMAAEARQAIDAKTQAGALCVIYLKCDFAVLVTRRCAMRCDDRPAWNDESIEEEIERTLRERGPTFEALAGMTFDTSAVNAHEAVDRLLLHIRTND